MTDAIKEQIEHERELRRLQTLPRFAFADRELAKLFAKLIRQFPHTTEPEPEPKTPSKELVKWMRERNQVRRWNANIGRQAPVVESYDQLEGEWRDWFGVAIRYEQKVPYQDREDLRHTIILELALLRAKSQEPIPLYRAYRVASFMVADYYRQRAKLNTGLDCWHCSKAQRHKCREDDLYSECPKAIKLVSLDTVTIDSEGNRHTIKDTIADDHAIDLDQWLDTNIWLLGCPIRLIEIAHKKLEGKPLTTKERMYLSRYRRQTQKRPF